MAKPMEEIMESIRNRYRRICPVCGKEFSAIRPNHKFCSAECRTAHYKSKGRKRNG